MDIKSITIPKTNYSEGRGQYRPSVIVIHIAEGDAQSVRAEFTGNTEKSSHYLVCKNREVWQFVEDEDTAWANGTKVNPTAKYVLERPEVNPNLYSLSIENEGFTGDTIYESQYIDNADLVLELCEKWKIPLDENHIIPHNKIRADKRCPLPISVERILKLAQEKKAFQQKPPEEKIEELKKVQISILRKILSVLQEKLKLLLNRKT